MGKLIIIAILMSLSAAAHSQVPLDMINKHLYETRIKLVDEFFERFNGEEAHAAINKDDKDFRQKNLLFCFNGKMFKSAKDSCFIDAQAFIKNVIDDSLKIRYKDSTWIAKAVCCGKFKGNPVKFNLYLHVEHRRGNMYKWVISKAEGDIFKLEPSLRKDGIMLMPDDHETNFMSLRRITTEKDDYILNYAYKDFHADETSVFYSMVYNGLLDIDYVDDLSFIFFQVPDYQFTVRFFERETDNSGWLISDLKNISEEDKMIYFNQIYNK